MKLTEFIIIILIYAGYTGISKAQEQQENTHKTHFSPILQTGGEIDTSIKLIQDPRIDALIKKQVAINEKQKGIPGYRVQIFFGFHKKGAIEVKQDFLEKYPDTEAYILYDQPYFKVRVGNCRTRLKAKKLYNEISVDFHNGFIVEDLISVSDSD